MIGVGVIGYGYWGPNLVRNFHEAEDSRVVVVCDFSPKRLGAVAARYPSVRTTTQAGDVFGAADVEAVAVATPVSTHFELAMQALGANKHVLVEKPITDSSAHALELIEEANRRGLVLMVDHTFIYTGPVRKIHELVVSDALGKIYYYDSVRINLGLFQSDINVLWDLAVHDLSILDHVLPYRPCAVSATGISHISGQPEDTAYMTLFFEEDCIGHVHVSWLSPVKLRRTLVGGSHKMAVYDDLQADEKIKVYDTGISVNISKDSIYKLMVDYRTGDVLSPHIDRTEALAREVSHFNQCVRENRTPITSGLSGLNVVRILEAATESMAERGRPVTLEEGGLDDYPLCRSESTVLHY